MKDVVVVVPTYEPNETIMMDFISKLQKEFKNIIIVNDGNRVEFDDLFKKFSAKKIKVLKNNVNLGKGVALKHAYNVILNEYPKCKVVVSADCDGQHTVEDIKKIAEMSLNNPESLVVGVRDFNDSSVPKTLKICNKINKIIMQELIDLNITDTQTGLRAMSYELIKTFIKTSGDRYEYEANELIDCKEKEISIIEVPIETIFIDGNSESNFTPITDSLKIFKLFSKYYSRVLLAILINVIIFSIILKFVTLPNVITVTFAIIIANLLSKKIGKIRETDIVNYIVYLITLVVLTLILSGITNISYLICYIICMLLSYTLLRLFFE